MVKNWKAAFLVLLPWAFSMQGCSRTRADPYLTSDIMKNYSANMNAIENALDQLAEHSDAGIRAQVLEYWRHLTVFEENCVQPLLSEGAYRPPDNPARVYRKTLRIPVPAEVKKVYLQYGLGGQGHQVYLCLFLGTAVFLLQQEPVLEPPAQKLLGSMESLIHPQDMTLIREYFDALW